MDIPWFMYTKCSTLHIAIQQLGIGDTDKTMVLHINMIHVNLSMLPVKHQSSPDLISVHSNNLPHRLTINVPSSSLQATYGW